MFLAEEVNPQRLLLGLAVVCINQEPDDKFLRDRQYLDCPHTYPTTVHVLVLFDFPNLLPGHSNTYKKFAHHESSLSYEDIFIVWNKKKTSQDTVPNI